MSNDAASLTSELVHLELKRLWTLFSSEHQIYNSLYRDSQDSIDVLTEAASSVFFVVHNVFSQHLVIVAHRFLEKGGGKQQNLTVPLLCRILVNEGRVDLASSIREELNKVSDQQGWLAAHRHKLYAHQDVEHVAEDAEGSLPRLLVENVEDILKCVSNALNIYELAIHDSQTIYDDVILKMGTDGVALLERLRGGHTYWRMKIDATRLKGDGAFLKVTMQQSDGLLKWETVGE